jgi:hypothetical protein
MFSTFKFACNPASQERRQANNRFAPDLFPETGTPFNVTAQQFRKLSYAPYLPRRYNLQIP